ASPKSILDRIRDEGIQIVDFRFTDFPGLWQHFSVPAREVDEDTFEDGLGFDGSSIRGWQVINESDMLVVPDADTAFIDPYFEHKTLVMTCNIVDPITRESYGRDPRGVARAAEAYVQSTGLADTAYFGPEAEFFIFDDVRFDGGPNFGFYEVDSIEGRWNSGADEGPNLGYKPRYKEGYFPVPPTDKHHEMADAMMLYKYIIKNTAARHGKTVTFMPKPLFEDNGSGMHTHLSLWKDGVPLFAGDGYAGLSDMAMHAIGGLLKHAPALLAFTNPTTNSYKRLVPGFEAPVNLVYSQRNRSAAVRIPMYSPSPKAKRVEFRCPDPSCNPYLAFAALLMAALDGIQNEIDPGSSLDVDIYDLSPEESQ
ncbi:MAG: glutamine synthetase beta-grasp domain-containing protein, partial [Acidobacteriota bacterium]|nr:glutamine synthetase beta-grasp domain-containing protein [Acidobacteriota bacterium]